jgi:hypothetical protein
MPLLGCLQFLQSIVNNLYSKTKFSVILHLWDKLITENDELFIHFIIIALLIKNKQVSSYFIRKLLLVI